MVIFGFLSPKLVGLQRKVLKKKSQISDISSFQQLHYNNYPDLPGTLRDVFCRSIILL